MQTNKVTQTNNQSHKCPKVTFTFDKRITFDVDPKYVIKEVVGRGSLGVVASAENKQTQSKVAVKMIMNLFRNPGQAKRELREIKILKFLKHKNIVSLLEIMRVQDPLHYNEIYLVLEYVPLNLKRLIQSSVQITQEMIQCIMFQVLDGIHFMHSAGIIHRDLKPENILMTKKLDMKIADMNLARKEQENLTKYVVTRPYRAPQLILSEQNYNKAIDIWSIGCIFAELIGKTVLFDSENCIDQFKKFVTVLGKPKREIYKNIDPMVESSFNKILNEMPDRKKIDWKTLYSHADQQALDLLDHMLVYDVQERYTAEQCLKHPYMQSYKKKYPIRKCGKTFDFSFDELPAEQVTMRRAIFQEAESYHQQAEPDHQQIESSCLFSPKQGNTQKRERPHSLESSAREQESVRKMLKPE